MCALLCTLLLQRTATSTCMRLFSLRNWNLLWHLTRINSFECIRCCNLACRTRADELLIALLSITRLLSLSFFRAEHYNSFCFYKICFNYTLFTTTALIFSLEPTCHTLQCKFVQCLCILSNYTTLWWLSCDLCTRTFLGSASNQLCCTIGQY